MSDRVAGATLASMEHVPPPAEELVILDRELARLDLRRSQLLTRRTWLLSVLQAPGPLPAAPHTPQFPPPPARTGAWLGAPASSVPSLTPSTPPVRTRSAQNVLLTLGGLLLTIAAIAFTLVSWGQMGIGGRSAVLTAVTVAALTAPAVLLRRGLSSTAEALGALASVLMVLDAVALYLVAVPDAGGLAYTAAASAVLALLWTAYGLLLDRLRLPLPLAVVSAQLPLVLWAWAAEADALVFAVALLATAALDCAIAVWFKGVAVRVTACAGLWATGGTGLLVALVKSLSAGGPAGAVLPGVLLLVGAVIALAGARRAPVALAVAGGVVAGLAVVAAVGGVATARVPDGWAVPVYLVCGGLLLLGVRAPLGCPATRGLVGAAGAVTAASVLFSAAPVAVVLVGPVSQLGRLWSGTMSAGVRGPLGATDLPWQELAPAPVVLLMVAAALGVSYRSWEGLERWAGPALSPGSPGPAWRTAAATSAVVLGWAGLTVLPPALNVSYTAALSLQWMLVAAVVALALGALRRGMTSVAVTAWVCASVGAAGVALLSLGSEPATYAVFGALLLLFAGAATALDTPGEPSRSAVFATVQAVLACAAVVCAAVLAAAFGASMGLALHEAAPMLLVVPAVTAGLGARLKGHSVALPLELTGAGVGLAAVLAALGDPPFLALVLALGGVLAAGTALRPERREVAGYLATGLFVLASWVRLSASGVTSPEAYTLPVTVPALVIGVLRRRRDPAASSWTAYGAGLAVTLVPALVAAWGDPHWLRPLLLGVATLVITLLGARLRLQALLVLGGAVLALDALHELAPYVVQVVGAMPRWVAPALAGVLLLAVGATYEKRLRDARRLRDALGRMR